MELHILGGAIVGSPGASGLSVEQRKRLTIAVELVANPAVVFMGVSCCVHDRTYLVVGVYGYGMLPMHAAACSVTHPQLISHR